MEITVEDVEGKDIWRLWHIDDLYKTHLGTVSHTMGEKALIHTVKELEDRWSCTSKNLMYNTQTYIDYDIVYSDGFVPYLKIIDKEDEE